MGQVPVRVVRHGGASSNGQGLGIKSWGREWQTLAPHINWTINDFLGALSANHKTICLQWMHRWQAARYTGNDVLAGLIGIVTVAA